MFLIYIIFTYLVTQSLYNAVEWAFLYFTYLLIVLHSLFFCTLGTLLAKTSLHVSAGEDISNGVFVRLVRSGLPSVRSTRLLSALLCLLVRSGRPWSPNLLTF